MRFVTEENKDDDIARAIESREREISNYDLNVANFQSMLQAHSGLNPEWPGSIIRFKGQNPHKIADLMDDETYELFSRYAHRDQVRVLLRTTLAERAKSVAALQALELSAPKARIDAAETRIKAAKENLPSKPE